MDYGVTKQGFLIKRFQQILDDNREYAETVFADLLEDGEELDTTDSSIVGRLTKLVTPSTADLWQVAQSVYSSLDVEQASGINLDILAQYSGLTRLTQSRSATTLVLGGDTGTLIPRGSIVRDSKYGTEWYTLTNVTLDTENSSAITVTPLLLDLGTEYVVNIKTLYSDTTVTVTNNIPNATLNDVLALLQSELNTPLISSEILDGELYIQPTDLYSKPTFTLTNLVEGNVYSLVNVQSVEFGKVSSNIGRVTDIATPVLGWSSAYNPFTVILGRVAEDDITFRERISSNKTTGSVGFAKSIKDKLLSILGVREVNLYENTFDYVDSRGLPPHSFKVVINGGNPTEIASGINEGRPLGIGSFGDTTAEFVDDSGQVQEEMFSRPKFEEVFMEIDLSPEGDWNNELTRKLKQAIVKYFDTNITIGESVSYSRLFIPINSIPEQRVTNMKIGLGSAPTGYQDLPIDYDALAVIGESNITVNIV